MMDFLIESSAFEKKTMYMYKKEYVVDNDFIEENNLLCKTILRYDFIAVLETTVGQIQLEQTEEIIEQ
ncbi:hypothetical protein DICVIV_11928 [Dictyocaulus viviparus]|uniref:Uncharacterized protein n=1 Tax=Dictyocaulus viviparus TaxID=29172 RepID=A0A0D8XEI9_DICVI|nr:hypothetical protein DICVIV_11928 [Dictyocaulus viviparus]